jgi:nucleotide-binding universal stress UspA family protein
MGSLDNARPKGFQASVNMFKHILVPLDGSVLAECVLPHVTAVAGACASQITLLQVLEHDRRGRDGLPVDALDWEMKRSAAQAYLDGVNGRLLELDLTATPVLVEGDAAEAIVEFAQQNGVDLIIISSHGQNGLTGWNISSTVQKVILRAYVSTLVVPAYVALAEDWRNFYYRRIVVPLDGSQRAEWVLAFAGKLATMGHGEVHLVYALAPPEMPQHAPPTQEDLDLSRRLVERNRQEIERYFEQIQTRLHNHVSTHLLSGRDVIPTLHDYVDTVMADLVVLSAHGYSESARWAYGSVTTSFIFHGATPLLIVQDLPLDKIKPTRAELVAQASGAGRRIDVAN